MGLALSPEQAKSLLHNYKVLSGPEQGGQKYVFKCCYDGELCAVKVVCLSEDLIKRGTMDELEEAWESTVRRSRREFDSMLKCSSNNLVQVLENSYRTHEVDGIEAVVFAEQWVEGYTLESFTHFGKKMREKDLINVAIDIGSAIKELAMHGLVHRDIKPSNIMFCKESKHYILLDLGLALDLNDSAITRTGYLVGTLPYLAPEQMDPKYKPELNYKTDFFALGTVLYELATGQRPYFRPYFNMEKLYQSIMREPLPDLPHVLNDEISVELSEIIMRLLAKRPNGRYRTPQFLIKELELVRG